MPLPNSNDIFIVQRNSANNQWIENYLNGQNKVLKTDSNSKITLSEDTSSWSQRSISSSYALIAESVINSGSNSLTSSYAFTASYIKETDIDVDQVFISSNVSFDWNNSTIQSANISGLTSLGFINPKAGKEYTLILDSVGTSIVNFPLINSHKIVTSSFNLNNQRAIFRAIYDGVNYNWEDYSDVNKLNTSSFVIKPNSANDNTTSSFASNALTASYALSGGDSITITNGFVLTSSGANTRETASHARTSKSSSYSLFSEDSHLSQFSITSSFALSASSLDNFEPTLNLIITESVNTIISKNLFVATSSGANNNLTASHARTSKSSSYSENSNSSSYSLTSSYNLNSISSSYSESSSFSKNCQSAQSSSYSESSSFSENCQSSSYSDRSVSSSVSINSNNALNLIPKQPYTSVTNIINWQSGSVQKMTYNQFLNPFLVFNNPQNFQNYFLLLDSVDSLYVKFPTGSNHYVPTSSLYLESGSRKICRSFYDGFNYNWEFSTGLYNL